ncbi:hypothetical protein NBRC110019_25380 [Neptunitalea chrysea]|uniref:Uncharacterized protein n=2 Tax=Neptunitalea chrysea TaxID=1647581 RepID=A0A9W6EW78_9FLAO|nr:hypothetical protein NBRC110019_25380 [Neptunitalea chrysea]
MLTDFSTIDIISGDLGYIPNEKRSDSDDVQSMITSLLCSKELTVTSANMANKQNKNNRSISDLRHIAQQRYSGTYGQSVYKWRKVVHDNFAHG